MSGLVPVTRDLPRSKQLRRTAMQSRTAIEQLSADIVAIGGLPGLATRSA